MSLVCRIRDEHVYTALTPLFMVSGGTRSKVRADTRPSAAVAMLGIVGTFLY